MNTRTAITTREIAQPGMALLEEEEEDWLRVLGLSLSKRAYL
jgi:hypothetical protein